MISPKTKKRILFMCGWYYPDSIGGTEAYVHSLAKELDARHFDVAIAAPSRDEKEYTYKFDGLDIYRYPVSRKYSESEISGETRPERFETFARWLRSNRPDLVHIHSIVRGCGLIHAKYVKEMGIPLALTLHTPELICIRSTMMRWGRIPCDGEIRQYRCGACYLQKRGLSKVASLIIVGISPLLRRLLGRPTSRANTALSVREMVHSRKRRLLALYGLADSVVVVSQWLYETLKRNAISPEKLYLCKHGIPAGKFTDLGAGKRNKSLGTINIGYIGRFHPVKGVHILIKAVRRLPKTIPATLRLYGSANNPEEEGYYRHLKSMASKDTRILFCGQLQEENRSEIFKDIDIVAIPSLWLETGPLVALEAFAGGTPVIGSRLGGIAELVDHKTNGILVKAGDIKAWSCELEQLCTNPESIEKFAKNIPKVRKSEEVTLEMSRLYTKILNPSKDIR